MKRSTVWLISKVGLILLAFDSVGFESVGFANLYDRFLTHIRMRAHTHSLSLSLPLFLVCLVIFLGALTHLTIPKESNDHEEDGTDKDENDADKSKEEELASRQISKCKILSYLMMVG